MEQTEEKILKAKKFNSKLFPYYKMFSWDLLFFYSISFLFFTQAKGFSASSVLVLDALYTLFKFIAQIPSVNIAEIIGKRKSLILSNVLITISIIIVLISKEFGHVVVSYAVMGISYSLKDLCDPIFLRDCITVKEHPGTAYTNLDGKGSAYWYTVDAITSITCGFLFVFNAYLPMCLCLVFCIISCFFAFAFKPYTNSNIKEKMGETGNYKEYFKDLKVAFKNIFHSRRLKSLLLFSGMFAALLGLRSTVASSLFEEIGVKEEYFGIIFAVLTIFSAISSRFQSFYHKTLKNRVLTYFSMIFSMSMIAVGLISMFSKSFTFTIITVFCLYSIQHIIKGPYYTLQKRYLNSFSSPSMVTKIYSATMLVESLFRSIICYFASILLGLTSTAASVTIIGCIFVIAFIFILDYMKDKIRTKTRRI